MYNRQILASYVLPPFQLFNQHYFTLLSLSHFEQTLLVLLLLLPLRRGSWKFLINVNIRNSESPAELHAFEFISSAGFVG